MSLLLLLVIVLSSDPSLQCIIHFNPYCFYSAVYIVQLDFDLPLQVYEVVFEVVLEVPFEYDELDPCDPHADDRPIRAVHHVLLGFTGSRKSYQLPLPSLRKTGGGFTFGEDSCSHEYWQRIGVQQ